MSYSEENGQVVLRMSREDYERLIFRLGLALGNFANSSGVAAQQESIKQELAFLNRLNQGNPDYTPYQVEQSK
jgi:hypothetical protein